MIPLNLPSLRLKWYFSPPFSLGKNASQWLHSKVQAIKDCNLLVARTKPLPQTIHQMYEMHR